MTQEDFKHSIVVTKTAKRLAWIVVIFLNIYFVYFSVLRGITRSVSWQYDYLMACVFQLIVEIVIYETGECLWIHFTIPKLVSEDVATTMNTVKHAIHLAFQKGKVSTTVLDSPKYFFVSRKLAEEFPNLFESSVVLAFQSYFPPGDLDTTLATHPETNSDGENSTTTRGLQSNEVRVRRRVKKRSAVMVFVQRFNFSVFVLAILQHLGTVPIRIQQVIIHTIQPILFSFMIILYFYLVKYPIMALLPMGFILYESVTYAYRIKNNTKKSIPAINDTEKNASRGEEEGKDSSLSSITDNASGHEVACSHCGKNQTAVVGSFCYHCGGKQPATAADTGSSARGGNASCKEDSGGNGSGGDSDSDSSDESDVEGDVEKRMKQFATRAAGLVGSCSDEDEGDDSLGGGGCHDTSKVSYDRKDNDSDDEEDQDDVDGDKDKQRDDEDEDEAGKCAHSGVNTLSLTDKRVYLLQRDVNQADFAVKKLCVDLGLNKPEDFEFFCDENSDEYRYWYQQKITPFVNKQGDNVTTLEIISMRNEAAGKDYETFRNNQTSARLGVVKRQRFNRLWDLFRLYDSDLVLPFVDQAGRTVGRGEIKAWRVSRAEAKEEEEEEARTPAEEAVRVLKMDKQVKEHKLFEYCREKQQQEQAVAAGNSKSGTFLPPSSSTRKPPPRGAGGGRRGQQQQREEVRSPAVVARGSGAEEASIGYVC
jgi:hypothetical protein